MYAHIRSAIIALTGLSLLAIGASYAAPAYAAGVVGTGTPASCTEAAVNTVLAGGGLVTFNCGAAPHTITLTSSKDISVDTSIDGGNLIALSGGATTRLFTVKRAGNPRLTLRNLAIRDAGGAAAGAVYVEQAGAERGYLTTENVDFIDNQNGAIWTRGTVQVNATTFQGHPAPAITVETTGEATVTGGVFEDNVTFNDSGGAIFNQGVLIVRDSRFTGNGTSANMKGGAINNEGEATVTTSEFIGNVALAAGGAIFTRGDLTVDSSTFAGNRALGPGGAIAHTTRTNAETHLTVRNSVFYDNEADDAGQVSPQALGGAIHVETDMAQATISNSTLSDNQADKGGGGLALVNRPEVALINVTLADNVSATTAGDNIEHRTAPQPAGTLTLQNTLVVNGTCLGPMVDGGNNMQDPGGNCVGAANDPQLGPLQDNGGWTLTRALSATSPARNAGANAACPAADQRGVLRPQNAVCDIGAFEYGAKPVLTSIDPSSILTLSPSFTLTASGSSFIPGPKQTRILWNGAMLPTTYVDSETLRAQVPASNIVAGGAVSIKLVTPVVDGGESDATQVFTVIKRDQTIAFGELPPRDVQDPPFAVSAIASSGLAVTFSAQGVCTVSGNTVTLAGTPGMCTITARQPGNQSYNPAPDVARSFAVVRLAKVFLPAVAVQ